MTVPQQRVLVHGSLDPASRLARLLLAEKNIPVQLYDRFDASVTIPPDHGERFPVFTDLSGLVLEELYPLMEYLEEAYPEPGLLGTTLGQRVSARSLFWTFFDAMTREVTLTVVQERWVKMRDRKQGIHRSQDSRLLARCLTAFDGYAQLIHERYETSNWLAGDLFSIADAMAGAQISILDLLGQIDWAKQEQRFPAFKDWYARVKSRASFRALLTDRPEGLNIPSHYADPDF